MVFLKTGFEALTGTGNSRESARRLRTLFESLPDTDAYDAEQLLWSPNERAVLTCAYKDRKSHVRTEQVTPLEHWSCHSPQHATASFMMVWSLARSPMRSWIGI